MLNLDLKDGLLRELQADLEIGLRLYWQAAGRVLAGSSVELKPEPPNYYAPQANFFSALFLYSYWRGGLDKSRRSLYVALNQCLRGMVTGCDNLLDDEYKPTLATDLPIGGVRFRSVMDIMVSDRVMYELLNDAGYSPAQLLAAGKASLAALVPSGAEEAREEGGELAELSAEQVLSEVHHYKTGLLFQSPWQLPLALESLDAGRVATQSRALYAIGMGCQVLDDMVDLAADEGHPNYLAALMRTAAPQAARRQAYAAALEYLNAGFSDLLAPEHQILAEAAIRFIVTRIGGEQLEDCR